MIKSNVNKSKVVDVKNKLHHPIQPKKKSHIGEYFAEFIIILFFFASIALTVYKYLGNGKFIVRDPPNLISITEEGFVGLNVKTPNSTLDIKSDKKTVFDISSYSLQDADSTVVDFKSNATTTAGDTLGMLAFKGISILSFLEEKTKVNDQISGRIDFLGGANLDEYGRFKAPGLMPFTSIGSVFSSSSVNMSQGCPDPSLGITSLIKYKGFGRGYLQVSDFQLTDGGLKDYFIGDAVKNTNEFFVYLPYINNTGQIYLNSTTLLSFPISEPSCGAIILPQPSSARPGDFINILCDGGKTTSSNKNFLSMGFRSVDAKPFAKNCILFNKHLQLGIGIDKGINNLWKFSDSPDQFYYTDNLFPDNRIEDVIVTNGSSNIIFLMIAKIPTNSSHGSNINSSADGTIIKFVRVGGEGDAAQWAVEGTTYANSCFFLQKTSS